MSPVQVAAMFILLLFKIQKELFHPNVLGVGKKNCEVHFYILVIHVLLPLAP